MITISRVALTAMLDVMGGTCMAVALFVNRRAIHHLRRAHAWHTSLQDYIKSHPDPTPEQMHSVIEGVFDAFAIEQRGIVLSERGRLVWFFGLVPIGLAVGVIFR